MNKLRQLAEKTKGWTREDKDFLLPILEELNIEAPTKNNCPSCWRDAAIMAIVKLGDTKKPVNGFRLKGIAAREGVLWRGKLVSPSTLNEQMVKWLVESGFPKHQYEMTDED